MARARGRYRWGLERRPPPLGEHSKAKHDVYREYLRRYLRELTKGFGIGLFRLNIVDGFCGGGIYTSGRNPYYGSPIILLEVLHEMQVELQARQTKPILIDYHLHLVDSDPGALEVLTKVLHDRGYGGLIGDRVFLHGSPFEESLPAIMADVTGRGSTIFILDQYGYTAVPFDLLQRIFRTLRKPEVILTFAYDHLVTWMQDYDRLRQVLSNMGITLPRAEFDAAVSTPSGRDFLIQRTLCRAFLSFADFYTPFFVMSRKSNMAFWLMHLSMHARARDVMTGLHWELQNHFAHFGGAGQHMLGFDPANPPPDTQEYLFDDGARERTLWAMQVDLPPLLYPHRDGIEFRAFFASIANGSPANSEITRQALIGLAEHGVIEIRTPEGVKSRRIVPP